MKRIGKSIRIFFVLVMALAITGGTAAYADSGSSLTEAQKNSSYGFFVWLSENADTSSERQDAEAAAQILSNTVSNANSGKVFNNGTVSSGNAPIAYGDLVDNMQLGAETDATNLDNLRQAIDFISLGNTYRAKENLAPLKVSSGLMAMAELNSDYQNNSSLAHSSAFLVLENLAYRQIGGTWAYGSFDGVSDDPYEGWYTKEKTYYDNGNEESAGHYKTLTDRQGTMLITGFGVRDRFVEEIVTASDDKDYPCNMHDRYYSQTFSTRSNLYDIGTGVTPQKYTAYLDAYEHQLKVEYCAAHGHTCTEWTTTEPATCTAQGTKTGTCSRCGETVTDNIPATNHNWGTPTYEWSSDNSKVTATRTCSNNTEASCTETETVSVSSQIVKQPTCIAKGETKYTSAAFSNSAFSVQTKTVADIDMIDHNWDSGTITTPATCTSKGVKTFKCTECDETRTEDVAIDPDAHTPKAAVIEHKVDPTCTANGSQEKVVYCSECNKELSRTTETLDSLGGHDWKTPTYKWSSDYKTVTATRTCAKNTEASCTETETVSVSSQIVKQPTCIAKGETKYTSAAFSNSAFSVQTKTVADIDMIDHNWDSGTITTPATCTSKGVKTFKCTECDETRTEDVAIDPDAHTPKAAVIEHKVDPTCTANGSQEKVVYCSECNKELSRTTETLDSLGGHDWQAPTYKWSSDYKSVTATRTCANNTEASCTETETVTTTSRVSKAPTYTAKGQTTYTAVFEGSVFETQTKTVSNIEMLAKKANTMTVKAAAKTLKVKTLKKKALTVAPITVKNAKGKVTYKLVSGNAKSKKALKLNTKTGKITVKKGTKKGKYSLKVKVSAAGTVAYKAASKTVTVNVRVK